jgi:hypothetical protein
MNVAALVISIAALGVSGASVVYTRRTANIETTRHHAERAPEFKTKMTDVNGDGVFRRLEVTLIGPAPLDEIKVVLPQDGPVRFTTGQSGVVPDSDGITATSYSGSINQGDTTMWRVEFDPTSSKSTVTYRVICRAGDEEPWTVLDSVDLPPQVWGAYG